MDNYGPSMPTKTIRVFTKPQIFGGEYSETNLNYYSPTMPTKTIRVFSGSQICSSEYSETNYGNSNRNETNAEAKYKSSYYYNVVMKCLYSYY